MTMMIERNHSRRNFLKTGLAATLGTSAGWAQTSPPARKLRIAGVGIGGMGGANLGNVAGEEIVALCDVDHAFAAGTFGKFPQARRWRDFRKMLEKQPEIEAVMIATPDHTHAAIALAALKAGKHVFCQKPLTHDIHEARLLARAAAAAKGCVAVMGNQHHSSEGARRVVEWVRSGVIGEVKRVIAWCSLNYRPFGNASWATLTDTPPVETPPVPATLAWDLWLGPAKRRAYHPTYHPTRWRAWWDFGCGMMGDRGVHTLDASCWALDLTAPATVELLSIEGANEFVHPDKAHVRYQFPARGGLPALQLDWHSGERPQEVDELTGDRKAGDGEGGALIIGSRGMISHGTYPSGQFALHPQSLAAEARKAPASLPALRGSHEAIWVAACKGNGPVSSGFSEAAALTEVTHLGNLAIHLGGRIDWNAVACQATNRPEAAAFIRMPCRPGWELPD
ncbi:MAG: Gfo/Idh/MocA family oxidoreductase [Verrucomicrobia bacterium]|nr:Gfo/Idh/MocA family oxidoreductase [Verrucomicrobiota bacterium]